MPFNCKFLSSTWSATSWVRSRIRLQVWPVDKEKQLKEYFHPGYPYAAIVSLLEKHHGVRLHLGMLNHINVTKTYNIHAQILGSSTSYEILSKMRYSLSSIALFDEQTTFCYAFLSSDLQYSPPSDPIIIFEGLRLLTIVHVTERMMIVGDDRLYLWHFGICQNANHEKRLKRTVTISVGGW